MCGCLWMSNVSSEFSAGDPPKPPGPLFFPLCNSEPIAKTFGPTAPGAPGAPPGAPGGAPKPLGALAAPGDRQGSRLILKNLQVRNVKLFSFQPKLPPFPPKPDLQKWKLEGFLLLKVKMLDYVSVFENALLSKPPGAGCPNKPPPAGKRYSNLEQENNLDAKRTGWSHRVPPCRITASVCCLELFLRYNI